MCLLVPVTGHLRVVGGDQRHLTGGGDERSGNVTNDTAERTSAGRAVTRWFPPSVAIHETVFEKNMLSRARGLE